MKKFLVFLAGSAIALSVTAATRHNPRDVERSMRLRAEVVRLRAHFDSVDRELRTADISRLSASQKAMRAELISWLRDYRNAGRFPENDRFANRRVPFFRDSHGTLCAMAYLIDRSGRSDIVDKVAATRNNAYIRELVDDPSLVAWLDKAGLSAAEAARIQPTYGGPVVVVEDTHRVSTQYAVLSMALGSVATGSTALNLFAPSRGSGTAGLISGAAAIVAGADHLRERGGNKRMAQADLTVGSIAAATSLYALVFKVKLVPRAAGAQPVIHTASLTWSPRLDVGIDGRFLGGIHATF
ncbi:MAG TPA: hypothetical protein VGD02_08895 [Gemmatimonadaceae bacterium]|jgi:hypothetical protein